VIAAARPRNDEARMTKDKRMIDKLNGPSLVAISNPIALSC
jgi:hypothetical protein